MVASTSDEPPAAPERPPIAGFWRRLAAFVVDALVLAVPATLLGFAMVRWASSLGEAGRLIGFVVALLYFGLLNSRLGGGQTLGKRLLGIRVTDRAGAPLSPLRASLRYLVLAVPYFLNGLWFDLEVTWAHPLNQLFALLLALVVFGGGGAFVYLLLFNRRTRQLPDDLVVGSFVVRGRAVALPARLATARLHLIVVGCWLVLVLGLGVIGPWVIGGGGTAESLKPLVEIQAAVRAQLGTRLVGVNKNTTTHGGGSTTTSLSVTARLDDWPGDADAVITRIAGVVLELHPDLLGSQVLAVRLFRGFDFGIASWSWTYVGSLDAAGWRAKLAHAPAAARKT